MGQLEPGTPYNTRLVRAIAVNGAGTLFGMDFLSFFDALSIFGSEVKISTVGPLGSTPGADAPPKNMDPSLLLVYDVDFNPKHMMNETMIHALSNDSIHMYDTRSGKRSGDPIPLAGIPDKSSVAAMMFTSTGKLYVADFSDTDSWLYSCVEVLGARGLSGYRCSQAQKLPSSFVRIGAGTAAPFYQMPPCLSADADPLAPSTVSGSAGTGAAPRGGTTMPGPATNGTVDPVASAFEVVWVYIAVGVVACVLVTIVVVVCVVNIMMKGRNKEDAHDTGSSIHMTQTVPPSHHFASSTSNTMRSVNSTVRGSPNPSANFSTMRGDSGKFNTDVGASQTYSQPNQTYAQPSGGNIEDEIPQYSFQTIRR